jgi:hypothetical protein
MAGFQLMSQTTSARLSFDALPHTLPYYLGGVAQSHRLGITDPVANCEVAAMTAAVPYERYPLVPYILD